MMNHTTGILGKSGAPVNSESSQKTAFDGRAGRSTSPGIPQSNSIPPEQLSGKAAANSGKLLMDTAASLGFPKDALSVALLVFTRFFSLSADKALIGSMRREILDLLKTSSPEKVEEKAALQARAMAAVIAADKGVVFSSGALERYARLLMQTPFMATPFMATPSEEKENTSSKEAVYAQKSRESSLEEIPKPDELRAIAEMQSQEDGLLDLLNYLPGKDGQYWLVFPFSVNINGIDLKVLLRILRRGRGLISGRLPGADDGQLIADISGPKRQWRCFLKKTNGKYRADIRVYPEYPQRALNHLRKQAERFFGKGGAFEEIIVRNGDIMPLLAEDLWPDHLPFIDEEVYF